MNNSAGVSKKAEDSIITVYLSILVVLMESGLLIYLCFYVRKIWTMHYRSLNFPYSILFFIYKCYKMMHLLRFTISVSYLRNVKHCNVCLILDT